MRFLNLLDTSSYTLFSLSCFSFAACSSCRNLGVTPATTSAIKTSTFKLTVTESKGEESRNYYLQRLVSTAKSHARPCFYWDNGTLGNNQPTMNVMKSGSDAFALFNHSSNPVMNIYDSGAVNTIMNGIQTIDPN